jgi:hypothetical protein
VNTPGTGAIRFRRAALSALLALSAAAMGCEDLVAPQRRRAADELPTGERKELISAEGVLEIPFQNLVLLPVSDFLVEYDDEWLTFRGIVIETVYEPDTGHAGSIVRGRRYLRAWRPDAPTNAFVMGGTYLPGPFGPRILHDESDEHWGRRAQLWAYLERRFIRHTEGEGDITRLTVGESCPWKRTVFSPWYFEADSLMRCDYAEYSVGFRSRLKGVNQEGSLIGEPVSMRMTPQRVIGLRLTIRCNGSEVAVHIGCGELPRTGPTPPGTSERNARD